MKRKMKKKKDNILFLEYFPFLGGGQRITLKIAESLKEEFNVRFLCFNDGLVLNELKKMGIPYDVMKAPGNAKLRYFYRSIPFYFRFKKYLMENDVKLIYCNSYFTAKLATFVSKKTKIPVIWHKHVIIENKKDSYLAGQIRKISGYVDKIICVSQAVKRSMQRIGVDEKKLCVVYNGINVPLKKETKNTIRKKYGLNDFFVAGSIGFLRKNKGFKLLIKAATIVKRKKSSIKFFIAGKSDGDFEYERELKSLVEENDLKDSVIFGGYIDWFECMDAFDVFVLPSYAEPFGLVTVEAGACGIPVVAFATGGTPEIIKDGVNGFLAKEVSAEKLAEKIIFAYNKRKRLKAMGQKAKKIVKEKFSEKKMQKKVLNIIRKVINEKEKYLGGNNYK
ncbi:MAG TPA: glycosyltransferase family 4 protein [Candidatus Goldiibacteriota bacterium]|nr:glycosyltransferase family 4 protein [Candidatus Goldiibacteriota bacterium]